MAIIYEENITIFGKENNKKSSEGKEKELLDRIREIISKDLLVKSRLKHYITRYREEKRPSISYFEALLRILDFNKVL